MSAPAPPRAAAAGHASSSPLSPSSPLFLAPAWSVWLASGAAAGLSVDLVLFPLDTIKTRMQSAQGLRASGGFAKLFAGVASAAAGSAPGAALFFFTYESSKAALTPLFHTPLPAVPGGPSASGPNAAVNPLVHCMAAALGETVACLVRVPTENVKQKVQAGQYKSSFDCFRALMNPSTAATASSAAGISGAPAAAAVTHSALSNFYRGFGTTIMREIPFAFIQFPLYEWGKTRLASVLAARHAARHPHHAAGPPPSSPALDGWQCACLGSLSGGVAAALTTPLDVVKTRLMLQESGSLSATGTGASAAASRPLGFSATFRSLLAEGGVPILFSGVVPRVMWISIGGFVFFGAYEGVKKNLQRFVAVRD